MRRLSLSDVLKNWRRVTLFVAIFVSGTLFGNLVIPFLFHDVLVLSINGSVGKGCANTLGLIPFRFGMYQGHGDGVYEIPCDERMEASDTVHLHCDCG